MSYLISFYIFLIAASVLIFFNTHKIWLLNKDFTIPISIFFIYYFTLGGAIIFPLDAYSGFKGAEIGLHYLPMFERLFIVCFDFNYFIACLYYVLFILAFQYSFIYFMKKSNFKSELISDSRNSKVIIINTGLVLFISMTLILISFYLLRDEIFYAIANEKSIYLTTRANSNTYYTLHQLANEFSVILPFIVYAFAILKNNKFNIKIKQNKFSFAVLLISCIISSLYIGFLGNRREILSGIVICTLISLNEYKNINYKRLATIFTIVIAIFLMNNFFRSTAIPVTINKLSHPSYNESIKFKTEESHNEESGIQKSKAAIGSFIFSNELFYAHFSMYGVLDKKVPITYGSSMVYLISSLIPRSIYTNRPPDVYTYYAKSVNAVPGQIYTIHHATAWYLNFGILGIFLGAIILAAIFAFAFKLNRVNFKSENKYVTYLKFLMPFLICSQIVTFITAGPEAYKAMIIEGVCIPVFLIGICSTTKSILKV